MLSIALRHIQGDRVVLGSADFNEFVQRAKKVEEVVSSGSARTLGLLDDGNLPGLYLDRLSGLHRPATRLDGLPASDRPV